MESDYCRSKTKEIQQNEFHPEVEEEEDLYNLTLEDIYDTVDATNTYDQNPVIRNRPPATMPRPELPPEPEQPYICRGISTLSDFSTDKHLH